MKFSTKIDDIHAQIATIDPKLYAKTRNFGNGAVTKLSSYISRGVISTRYVYKYILSLEKPWHETEKLIQELAWRDYWQQVWIAKGDAIFGDLKNEQNPNGEWQETWDGMFWRFVIKHKDFFSTNPRTAMLVNTLNKMPDDKRETHLKNAELFIKNKL